MSAEITYTIDDRRIESSGGDDYGSYNNIYYPDAPFADWSYPGQTSSLSASGFSAIGSGEAYSEYDWYSNWSFFDVSFNLSEKSRIDLTGNLWGEDFNYGSGDASVTLYDFNGTIVYSNSVAASYGLEEATISYSVVVPAGDYRIVAKADPYFEIAYSSYSLDAAVAPSMLPPGPIEPETLTEGVFELYDLVGDRVPTKNDSIGNAITSDVRDIANSSWTLSSTDALLGIPWYAHDGVIYSTPGVYEIDTIEGGVYRVYLAEGYTMGHILIELIDSDVITDRDIDVINIWDANGNSIDGDGDGISGVPMIDGPFPGWSANFSVGGGATLELNPALWSADSDQDGYIALTDCNDNDATVHPGAAEVKHDGIDQDCNGYDLTIEITSAVAKSKGGGTLSVTATSGFGATAKLSVDGYGVWLIAKEKMNGS